MESTAHLFDRMLTITADLFFELEKELFFNSLGGSSRKVLDIGCGNGDYLSRMCDCFPDMEFTGVEIDEDICRIARTRQRGNMTFHHSSYDGIPDSSLFDLVIARLVIRHIRDRRHLIRWLYEHTHNESTILIIDFDDDAGLAGSSSLPLFTSLFKQSRQMLRNHGFLNVTDALMLEFEHSGFRRPVIKRYKVTSDNPAVKQKMYAYMRLVTEYVLGSPIPAERAEELLAWSTDPGSRFDVHMFGMEIGKT